MITSRRISLEHAPNTRDLGGMETKDGRTVKSRRLLRSGALGGLTEEEGRILTEEYGLNLVIDFRTRQERTEYPDRELPGVDFLWLPIFGSSVTGITREESGEESMRDLIQTGMGQDPGGAVAYMASVYASMIQDPHSRDQYRRFLELTAAHETGAVLWHCSAGKDRVGVGTALLLLALGVPEETIMEDYLATNAYTEENRRRILASVFSDATQKERYREDHFKAMLMVDRAYLQGAFDAMAQLSGSPQDFVLEGLGLSARTVQTLRENYLESC